MGAQYTWQNIVPCSFEAPQTKPLTLQGAGTALEKHKTQWGTGFKISLKHMTYEQNMTDMGLENPFYVIGHCFSKCGPKTSCIITTWALARNANFQPDQGSL